MAEQKGNLLYDIINDMFGSKDITTKYSRETLKQFQFMINRIISIKYPKQANFFNRLGVDPKYSAYVLGSMIYNGGYKERWCFTKGSKKAKEEKNKGKTITPKLIKDYCSWYNRDKKDVDFALKIYKDEMEQELIEFSNMQKQMNEK